MVSNVVKVSSFVLAVLCLSPFVAGLSYSSGYECVVESPYKCEEVTDYYEYSGEVWLFENVTEASVDGECSTQICKISVNTSDNFSRINSACGDGRAVYSPPRNSTDVQVGNSIKVRCNQDETVLRVQEESGTSTIPITFANNELRDMVISIILFFIFSLTPVGVAILMNKYLSLHKLDGYYGYLSMVTLLITPFIYIAISIPSSDIIVLLGAVFFLIWSWLSPTFAIVSMMKRESWISKGLGIISLILFYGITIILQVVK